MSFAFKYLPFLKNVSSGFVIIICAVSASALFAIIFPIENNDKKGNADD